MLTMLRETLPIASDKEKDNKREKGGEGVGAAERETQTGGRRAGEWCKMERITNECLPEWEP